MIEKNCMRNVLNKWKISTEKNFGKSKKKKIFFEKTKFFLVADFFFSTQFFLKYFSDFRFYYSARGGGERSERRGGVGERSKPW